MAAGPPLRLAGYRDVRDHLLDRIAKELVGGVGTADELAEELEADHAEQLGPGDEHAHHDRLGHARRDGPGHDRGLRGQDGCAYWLAQGRWRALPSLLAPSALLRRAGVARRENSAGGTPARPAGFPGGPRGLYGLGIADQLAEHLGRPAGRWDGVPRGL